MYKLRSEDKWIKCAEIKVPVQVAAADSSSRPFLAKEFACCLYMFLLKTYSPNETKLTLKTLLISHIRSQNSNSMLCGIIIKMLATCRKACSIPTMPALSFWHSLLHMRSTSITFKYKPKSQKAVVHDLKVHVINNPAKFELGCMRTRKFIFSFCPFQMYTDLEIRSRQLKLLAA